MNNKEVLYGYHYTTAAEWGKIKFEGLIPYQINNEAVKKYYKNGIKGVWIFTEDQVGEAHVGTIINQVARKCNTKIVKLKIKYRYIDLFGKDDRVLDVSHSSNIENWYYNEEPAGATVIRTYVPPGDIKLVGVYDLMELLR